MKKLLLLIFASLSLITYLIFFNQNSLKVEYIAIGNQKTKNIPIASFDTAAKPKNIILIIGDGTGFNQITLSRIG